MRLNSTPSIQALPRLILTDTDQIVRAEGFALSELDEKLKITESAEGG